MKTLGENRRRATRFACLLSVQYRTTGGWHPAVALDLTETGCRLRLGEDVERSSPITVRFDAPIKDGATSPCFELRATVMWCQLQGLSHQAGLLFAGPPDELREILRAIESWAPA